MRRGDRASRSGPDVERLCRVVDRPDTHDVRTALDREHACRIRRRLDLVPDHEAVWRLRRPISGRIRHVVVDDEAALSGADRREKPLRAVPGERVGAAVGVAAPGNGVAPALAAADGAADAAGVGAPCWSDESPTITRTMIRAAPAAITTFRGGAVTSQACRRLPGFALWVWPPRTRAPGYCVRLSPCRTRARASPPMIEIRPVDAQDEDVWRSLLQLRERYPEGWTLIGAHGHALCTRRASARRSLLTVHPEAPPLVSSPPSRGAML